MPPPWHSPVSTGDAFGTWGQCGHPKRLHGAEPPPGRQEPALDSPQGLLALPGPSCTDSGPWHCQPLALLPQHGQAARLGSRAGSCPGTGARGDTGQEDMQPRVVRRGWASGMQPGAMVGEAVTNAVTVVGQGARGWHHLLPQTLPEGQGGQAPNTPRVLSPWEHRQNTWRSDKGASGDLPTAWHRPMPRRLPSPSTQHSLGQWWGAQGLPVLAGLSSATALQLKVCTYIERVHRTTTGQCLGQGRAGGHLLYNKNEGSTSMPVESGVP